MVRLDRNDAEILVGFAAQHQPSNDADFSYLFPSEQSREDGCAYLNSLLQESVNALVPAERTTLPWCVERLHWQKLSEDELRAGGRDAVVQTARRQREQAILDSDETTEQLRGDGESGQPDWYGWLQQQALSSERTAS